MAYFALLVLIIIGFILCDIVSNRVDKLKRQVKNLEQRIDDMGRRR